jgi:hypothetical protein
MVSGINWDDVPETKTASGINWNDVSTEETKPDSFGERVLTGAADPMYGLAQMYWGEKSPLMALPNAVARLVTGENIDVGIDEAVREREAEYQAPEGFDAARMVGTAVNPITWLGPGKAKAGATALGQLGKHLGVNTLQGLMMPTTDEDFVADKSKDVAISNVIGGLLSGVSKGAGKAYDVVSRNLSDEMGQAGIFLKDLFGDRSNEVAERLRNIESPVSGQKPTAAWAGLDEFPELVALEQNARSAPGFGGQFNVRDAENAAAMLRQFDEVIGEGAPVFNEAGRRVKTPIQERAAQITGPMYDEVAGERILLPKVKSEAIDAAQNRDILNLQEKARRAGWSDDPAVRGATQTRSVNQPVLDVMDPTMSRQALDQPFDILPTDTVGSIQAKRKVIDSMISAGRNATDPAATANLRNLQQIRAGMSDWLRGASPGFKEAEETFIREITPQNRADIVNQLRGRFADEGGDNPVAFLRGLGDIEGTARKAGMPIQVDSLRQAMRPDIEGGQEAITAVNQLRDAARRDVALRKARGVDVGDMEGIGEKVANVLPPIIDPKLTAFKKAMNITGGKQKEKLDAVLNEATLDPNKLADLIDQLPPEQRNRAIAALREYTGRYGQIPTGALKREAVRDEE